MQTRSTCPRVLILIALRFSTGQAFADDVKLAGASKGEYREGAVAGRIDSVPINVGTDGKYIKIVGVIDETGEEFVNAVLEA